MARKKKQFDVIVRPNARIKSRQWWINKIKKLSSLLLKYLSLHKKQFFKNSSFTLLVTNNKEIQNLNKTYRKINKPTDVLSFHLNKNNQISKKYLGDIVISASYAQKQAIKNNISFEVELQMLLIHGYLHLLGYDHKSTKDAKIMFPLQNELLERMK